MPDFSERCRSEHCCLVLCSVRSVSRGRTIHRPKTQRYCWNSDDGALRPRPLDQGRQRTIPQRPPSPLLRRSHPSGSSTAIPAARWSGTKPASGPPMVRSALTPLCCRSPSPAFSATAGPRSRMPEWSSPTSSANGWHVARNLLSHADEDGIVCIPSVRGESARRETGSSRLLASSFRDEWNDGVLSKAPHRGRQRDSR